MASIINPQISRRTLRLPSSSRPHPHTHKPILRLLQPNTHHRTLQTNSSTTSPPTSRSDPSKPIPLDKPDKFRPPSHASRLPSSRRSTTGSHYASYNGSASYNQGVTEQEREAQRTRTYPNMFPNPGTLMYRFLTNRAIHLWITLGTLTLLALTTLTQSFLHTSPFAHLLPPITSLFYTPLTYIREVLSVYKLSVDYTTEQTWQARQSAIADAQKRRLYRRAHGMEDLDAAEDQGIDVRGLVEWDDGLTNREREKQGGERRMFEMSRRGLEVLEGRKRAEDNGEVEIGGRVSRVAALGDVVGELQEEEGEKAPMQQQQKTPRKVKRWLGIWE